MFKRFLPKAGALIPFVPAQLELSPEANKDRWQSCIVQRHIALQLDSTQLNQIFQFTPKYGQDTKVVDLYRDIVNDRVAQVALAIGGPSKQAIQMEMIVSDSQGSLHDDAAISLAKEIVDVDHLFGRNKSHHKTYLMRALPKYKLKKGKIFHKNFLPN